MTDSDYLTATMDRKKHLTPALSAPRGGKGEQAGDARATYRRIARYYDFLDGSFERKRYAPIRGELFAGLGGRILDAGVGTGRNIPYYPDGAEVVGVDLSQAMLAEARARRDGLGSAVPLAAMDVLRTAFPDSSFDAVVASFVFCVLRPDQQRAALAELGRILKPGGEVRLLDYTWSRQPVRRLVMALWAPWVRWAYGAGFDREPHRHVEPAGLALVESRFLIDDVVRLVVARRPST